jgi:iron(III) transport system substrate-binding protein
MRAFLRFSLFAFHFSLLSLLLASCGRSPDNAVTLFTSVDEPIASPIVKEFEKQTGIHVTLVTDAEATKSIGLAERLRAEKDHPQCDVFWANEPFNTINLAEEGVLTGYDSPAAKDVPEQFKDPQHRWASNGLRARVIAHTAGPAMPPWPKGLDDLTDHAYTGTIAMARPTAGTTGGHVAALYVLWGDAQAKKWFKGLADNHVKLLGGNSVVAEKVAAGTFQFGLTDNDDVAAAKANDGKIDSYLPNQGNGFGTLMIPTTTGLVANAKHPEAAKKLIDYLLSPEVEKKLLAEKFALVSVRELDKSDIKYMRLDYRDVARIMPRAIREATAILEGRE